jgi:hypothetical protein
MLKFQESGLSQDDSHPLVSVASLSTFGIQNFGGPYMIGWQQKLGNGEVGPVGLHQ